MSGVEILGAIASLLFAAGITLEQSTRSTVLHSQGNNDVTLTQCNDLCAQLKARWSENCLAKRDASSAKDRMIAAIALAVALSIAANALASIAVIPIYGAWAIIPAIVAGLASIVAAGAAASATQGFINATNVANGTMAAVDEAQNALIATCKDASSVASCLGSLPPCP